jgi:hypothetical protein
MVSGCNRLLMVAIKTWQCAYIDAEAGAGGSHFEKKLFDT